MAPKFISLFFLLICFSSAWGSEVKHNVEISSFEDTMEKMFGEYSSSLTNWLKSINDNNLVNSVAGRMLHYQELEPKIEKAGSAVERRNMKKMSSILPVIFQLGMTSAWMLLTTILTAKSVAIGLALLVMKIAVGSAKLASYFTAWKHNNHQPHHEHHGLKRSLRSVESHIAHQDWHSYSPEYSQPHTPYAPYEASSSPYASTHDGLSSREYEYSAETKKAQDKNLNIDEDEPRFEAESKESCNEDGPPYKGQLGGEIGPPVAGGHWEPKDSLPFGASSGGFWDLFY